jgi:hypothetical protein
VSDDPDTNNGGHRDISTTGEVGRRDVVVEFLGLGALAEIYFIGDPEVDGRDIRRIFGSNLYSFGSPVPANGGGFF